MGNLTNQVKQTGYAFGSVSCPDSKAQETAGWSAAAKVYVVDDDESIRQVMQALMEMNGIGVETFASAEDFLASYRPECPGCLLLDVHMLGMSGFQLQELLAKRGIHIPIIFLTAAGSVPKAVLALKMGAQDFIEKPFDYRELCERLRQSLRLDAEIRRRRMECVGAATRVASLTRREREVMEQILAGKPNKVIARALNICAKTVEFHRPRIMEKVGVRSVAELVQVTLNARSGEAEPRSLGRL